MFRPAQHPLLALHRALALLTTHPGLPACARPPLSAVLFPMMAANQGGPMLPWVVGAWATALLGGGLGITGGGAAKAAAGRT